MLVFNIHIHRETQIESMAKARQSVIYSTSNSVLVNPPSHMWSLKSVSRHEYFANPMQLFKANNRIHGDYKFN